MIRFPSRAVRDRYERSLLREETTRLSWKSAKLRAKLRNGKDIVHGWDDPRDFGVWTKAFAVLKPPRNGRGLRKPKRCRGAPKDTLSETQRA